MLRKTTVLIGCLLVLGACGSSITMTYTVTSSVNETEKNNELFQATERVLVRRLAGADVEGVKVALVPESTETASVTVTIPASATETLERIVSDPFTFDIRLENGTTVDEAGNEITDWQAIGVDGSMLEWVGVIQGPLETDVGVELDFTGEGRDALKSAFEANQGKDIGIFVRDLLVSKLKITSTDVNEHIIISGIPSAKVAAIFADDVNVGLHITFSPSK